MLKGYWDLRDTPQGALSRSLTAVSRRAMNRTDICDHLEMLFVECLAIPAALIVELGCGDGESTYVLERVAKLWDAALVSVDIEDRADVGSYSRRRFVKKDDVAFAAEFSGWCAAQGLPEKIDILFIDTSHLYEHTREEIAAWFPHLNPRCKVVFHDTHLEEVFTRKDGTTGRGWDNERGVIRAIEDYFGVDFDETQDFLKERNGWLIRHWRHCNGLMIMDRYD
ncbi:MAG TPA: class I SAM-dependent methyltransferase [Syntrophales bacterium]|nr:class I SAM-dependent methyltransferase [Syntrophales bacterium]HPJ97723.1 class I SAM-dependent methyltransferase [Syntrophales bacterium]